MGIAELCVDQMIDEGLTEQQACDKIYMMDVGGLITKSRSRSLTDRHKKFAKVELQCYFSIFENHLGYSLGYAGNKKLARGYSERETRGTYRHVHCFSIIR